MKFKIRFGPAGNPIGFNGKTIDVGDYIRRIGLEAYEYQATYGVRIQKQSALKLGKKAAKNDIRVSMHAPYYINLSSPKEDVLERSVQRLIQAARASEWMSAYRIVFHPGFYTNYTPKEALERCKGTIKTLLDDLESKRIKNFTFAPETTGKKSQLGNLDEIIDICQSFDHFAPTIDFAHLHARNEGFIKGKDQYHDIIAQLENKIGSEPLHCHFTRIEYTDAGERKHHVLIEEEYGPPLNSLLEVLIECGWKATIICETPYLERDALVMKETYQSIIEVNQK
jgi:deoxyribonuclease-4